MMTRDFPSSPRSSERHRWTACLLVFFLVLSPLGCATPPPAPAPVLLPPTPRTPVRVSAAPSSRKKERKPTGKDLAAAEEQAQREARRDEVGLQAFATALKKVPVKRRAPKKDEKIYPIDLNLKNADLVETIRVLADTLGLNYSIDPRVKGTVNVHASGKLTQSELLEIMESLLLVNGAAMVKTDKIYKIVPLEKSSTEALPVSSRAPVGMKVQVVFLEQTMAKEMLPVLKPMMSAGGSISEAAHNALVLVDYPANVDKLMQLIHLVDTRALSKTMIRIIKVHNTDPQEIISELETIFSAYGSLAQKGKFGVSFLSVQRINSVMVLASSGVLMERAVFWVRQLDLRTDMLANIHVYNVENYKARNLADLLTQAYGGSAAAPTIKEKKPETSDRTTGMRSPTGGAGTGQSGIGGLGSTSGQRTGGLGGTGTTGTGALGSQQGIGGTGAASLKERAVPLAGGAAAGATLKEGVRIIPDEENNLLVVVAPPHEWRIISKLLKRLDVMPRQVMNEVLIAEVRLTDELKYGIEFVLGGSPAAQTSSSTGQTGTSGVLVAGSGGQSATISPASTPGIDFVSGAGATFTAASGFSFVAIDTLNKLKGLINLLASQGRVDILASPQIMAANNQEARIQIGSDVPTLTSTSVPLVSQTTSFSTSTVQYRSTGIILSVKPQINANGLVTLDIAQEVSSVDTATSSSQNSPTFTVRSASTTLTTADNQTIVLGGLIREDQQHSQTGIPGLRKMPVLGPLFGSEGSSKSKTELIVLITPHIITNMEESARITQEMKDKVNLEDPPLRRPNENQEAPSY